jgi:NADPH2:quinone reductase
VSRSGTVRAAVCEHFGSHRDLVVREVPRPSPGPGQVRLRVAHSTVSFGQTLLVGGSYQRRPPLPFTPGTEVSGTVLELGDGVGHLAVGDRVAAVLDWGGYAEEAITTASTVYRVPDALDLLSATCLPLTYGTAYAALHWRGRFRAGETVLVLGAAGGVGLAAVEVALAGAGQVLATASTEPKRALVRSRGAHTVLPAEPDGLRDAVLEATGGRGVDIVFDPVGGRLSEEALRCLAPEGRMLVIGFASDAVPRTPYNILLVKNVEVIGFWFGLYVGWGRTDERERHAQRMRETVDALAGYCLEGRLRPEASMRFPLERIVDAFEAVASRQGLGRVIVDLAP